MRETSYFVSDAHFGLSGDESVKIERFGELVDRARGDAGAFYIVGDLFDFWIEYRRAVRPDYFPVLYKLRGLVDAGVEVRYIVGNHDFAIGEFLQKTIGITVHNGSVNVTAHGKRLHIEHGHRIRQGGAARFINIVLRNRVCQALYKIIHPNIGVWFGTRFSSFFKKRASRFGISEEALEAYRQAAKTLIADGGCDTVILAHTHHGEHVRFDGGGEYCNIGSFMDNYDYATLSEESGLQLRKWGSSAS